MRTWPSRPATRFAMRSAGSSSNPARIPTRYPREIALRIFRFGAHLYRLHQPHFLAEFLAEHLVPPLDTDAAVQAIALENIDAALTPSAFEPYFTMGEPATERRLQIANDLKLLRQRLLALSVPS